MAVDYLKTYLGIDPNDYSAMESRIRGEEPQARTTFMMQAPRATPQVRSLGDIEAMPMLPRSQPVQQDDSKYDGLMAEIASLKAQIEGMQAPTEQAPAPTPTPAPAPAPTPAPAPAPAVISEPYQAPVGIENRMVGEPEPFEDKNVFELRQEAESMVNPYNELPTTVPMPQAPSQDIQSSIDYLAKLPKMNIPQIPDMEEIKRKLVEANLTLPTPVSYQDQLQSIMDLPKITQMPMQNIPTPVAPVSSMPKFSLPQMQSFGRPSMRLAGGFIPEMRAGGGGIDKAIYDLKFKLNGS